MRRKDPNEKLHAIAGCVLKKVKDKIIERATRDGETISNTIGTILTEWAENQEEIAADVRAIEEESTLS